MKSKADLEVLSSYQGSPLKLLSGDLEIYFTMLNQLYQLEHFFFLSLK